MQRILAHCRSIFNIARVEMTAMLKEPIYYSLLIFGAAIVFFSKDFTMFTLDWASGDDPSYTRTMLREMGIATMLLIGVFLGILSASRSIYNEIERKTALTVLSKPVSRNDFILGKYFGILTGIIPVFLLLGSMLFITIALQSREDVDTKVIERMIFDAGIFKGVYINFLKAAVLVALSVAVSTRLPLLPNILIILTVFICGHLMNFLNGFFMKVENGFLFYLLQVLYSLTLNLDNYNYFYQGEGQFLPGAMLIFLVTLYTLIFTSVFLLIANISFSKRDLF